MNAVIGYMPLISRILIALPFIKFASDKIRNFDMVSGWMESIGVPAPQLTLLLGNTIELVGGIFLIVGLLTRWTALTMALYMIPVHLVVHNFWAEGQSTEADNFGKGMIIIGGLLYIFVFGAGRFSVDSKWLPRKTIAPTAPSTTEVR